MRSRQKMQLVQFFYGNREISTKVYIIKKKFLKNCINYIVKIETLGNTRFLNCSLYFESTFFIHLSTIKLQADLYGSACNCISRET